MKVYDVHLRAHIHCITSDDKNDGSSQAHIYNELCISVNNDAFTSHGKRNGDWIGRLRT